MSIYKIIFLFYSFMILSIGSTSAGEDCFMIAGQTVDTTSEKVYLKPEQIYFLHNKIFIMQGNSCLEIQCLKSDSEGLYYEKAAPEHWTCPLCGYYNRNTWYCRNPNPPCGWPND
jgi:hypothetical protein